MHGSGGAKGAEAVAAGGGIAPLVLCLASREVLLQRWAASALASMAEASPELAGAVLAAGAVRPAVRCLCSRMEAPFEEAIAAAQLLKVLAEHTSSDARRKVWLARFALSWPACSCQAATERHKCCRSMQQRHCITLLWLMLPSRIRWWLPAQSRPCWWRACKAPVACYKHKQRMHLEAWPGRAAT